MSEIKYLTEQPDKLEHNPSNENDQNEPLTSEENRTTQVNYPPPPYFGRLPQLNPNYEHSSPLHLTPINMLQMGAMPTRLRCPNCSADILTHIKFESGCLTWAIAGSICAIGLFAPCAWLGCQLIPFCFDSCKDVQHSCPNCRNHIGTFNRMK